MVRIYLGELRNNRPYMNFNLRNFPLYLDQIQSLDLNTDDIASTIANTLALVHFKAELDARDVEFVLGMSPLINHLQCLPSAVLRRMSPEGHDRSVDGHLTKRVVCLWMLDFNECVPITMDEEGMDMAAAAFYENAPYCPRPPKAGIGANAKMDEVWAVFEQNYLQTSSTVLRERAMDPEKLPRMFIEKVKKFPAQQ